MLVCLHMSLRLRVCVCVFGCWVLCVVFVFVFGFVSVFVFVSVSVSVCVCVCACVCVCVCVGQQWANMFNTTAKRTLGLPLLHEMHSSSIPDTRPLIDGTQTNITHRYSTHCL